MTNGNINPGFTDVIDVYIELKKEQEEKQYA